MNAPYIREILSPTKIILAASFALAFTFTLSCSGDDGSDGKNGIDGVNGTSCITQEKADGFDVICNGTKVGELKNGANGTNGTNGINGVNGVNGTDGISCTIEPKVPATAGYDVICGGEVVGSLVNGTDGAPGTNGANGTNGAKGDKGDGCTIATDVSNSAYFLITCGSATERLAKAWCGATAYDPEKMICEGSNFIFTDNRDGKKYKIVVIGSQTWMAENLNYNASGSKCGIDNVNAVSDANTSICDTYGRLYDWSTAVSACPTGWHLPSFAEWKALMRFVNNCSPYSNGCAEAGKLLKSVRGWWDDYIGEDRYGFSALPGGSASYDGNFNFFGGGYWWSSTDEYNADDYFYADFDAFVEKAYMLRISHDADFVAYDYNYKGVMYGIRCLQD